MDNTEIFDELTRLVHQPAIWVAARTLYGGQNQKPDNSRRLLRILAETTNHLTAGTIADILDIRPASVTQLIKKLEAAKYVERVQDSEDARVVRVKITDDGRQHLEHLDNTRQDFQADIFGIFSEDERQTFGEYLKRLNEHVASETFIKSISDNFKGHERMMFNHMQQAHLKQNERFTKAMQQQREHMAKHGFTRHDNNWFS